MNRRRVIPFLAAGFMVIAAGTVTFPSAGTARPASEAPAAVPRDGDALKAEATRGIPTFGGSYLDADGSTLHVWLTQPNQADATRARTALAGVPAGRTVVHRADYTFTQLTTWRSTIRSLLARPVTTLDIDERTNRISVGVENLDRDRPAAVAALARLGVPAAAVILEGVPAVTMALGDRMRPLHAGTQIAFTAGACTLGYPATRAGVAGIVTNSHCSTTRGVVDGGRVWQPTRPADLSGFVGTETQDSELHAGLLDCPVNMRCASGDASFYATVAGETIAQGRIARPALNSTTWNGTDTYRVTATTGGAADNAAVQKVGRTTGRTAGTVTETCQDMTVKDTDIMLFCQQRATYSSGLGDSGSPVFQITNSATNDVTAVGLNWGFAQNEDGTFHSSVFTPFLEVELEIGNINVCATGFAC
jgi:hypothetical protein